MAAFVGQHVHIAGGIVPVSKDEGSLVIRQIGHIAACLLGLSAKYIKELIFHHEIEKFLCLRGQLAVHLLSCCHDLLRSAKGCGISGLKIYLIVHTAKLIKTQAEPSLLMKLLCKGNQVLLDLCTELFYIIPVIAVSVHTIIAKLQIIFIAHFLCLGSTVLYQLIKDLIQLLFVGLEVFLSLLPCLLSDLSVLMYQIGLQQGKVQLLAVELDLGACDQLIVLRYQRIFLLA